MAWRCSGLPSKSKSENYARNGHVAVHPACRGPPTPPPERYHTAKTQSFMDYLLPSAHEMPEVEIVHHVTPSPHTVFGQKGSGESGYLGAPAAISSAINDAVRALNIR